jgi:hypothetical protein
MNTLAAVTEPPRPTPVLREFDERPDHGDQCVRADPEQRAHHL